MRKDIKSYNDLQSKTDRAICNLLANLIIANLPEADEKIWHAHPVWFLGKNPIVGYSKHKDCIRLMFWSGASFNEPALRPGTGKFKDASMCYTSLDQIDEAAVKRWLEKARRIQWDYANIVKRKGKLVKIGDW